MATCLWTSGYVRGSTIFDLHTASNHDPGWRHGPDYYGLAPPSWSVRPPMELHLLHLRLITQQLCRRIPLLFNRTRTANAVAPREQNLSPLLLVQATSIRYVCKNT